MSDLDDGLKSLNDALATGNYNAAPGTLKNGCGTYYCNIHNSSSCGCPWIALPPYPPATHMISEEVRNLMVSNISVLKIDPNHPTAKKIRDFSIIELNSSAHMLQGQRIQSLLHQFNVRVPTGNIMGYRRHVTPCEFACKIVDPKDRIGSVKKFVDMLNYLTDSGIWDYGTLDAGMAELLKNPFGGGHCEIVYAFIFINKDWIDSKIGNLPLNQRPHTIDLLNKELGVDIFNIEASVADDNWNNWPKFSVNLNANFINCQNCGMASCVCTKPAPGTSGLGCPFCGKLAMNCTCPAPANLGNTNCSSCNNPLRACSCAPSAVPLPSLNLITKEIDLDKYLNSGALTYSKNVIKRTVHVVDQYSQPPKTVPCLFFCHSIPKVNGVIEEKYIKAWADMLNWLVDKNIWNYGVLAACSIIDTGGTVGLYGQYIEPKTYIYSFIFGDYDFVSKYTDYNKKINEMMGWETANLEGQIPSEEGWDKCPFMVKTPIDLSRYPHKCVKCGQPSYNGLMSVDCSAKCS